jgi:glycosyltransferase involved in cell wall biosynthesis
MSSINQPLVSFVVPCYNYGHFLPDCLNSVFALTGGYDTEIIAIDDCSSDNTREVLAGYSDLRLRVIVHPQNKGHVFTVNEGLKETRGEYVVRVDPDDRYRPNFLTDTLPKFKQHPEVGLVYGDVAMIDAGGKVNCERCDVVHNGGDFKGNELIALLQRNFICAPSVIARREAWMSAWPIPEGLAFNDWYFNIMLARRYEFYYVDKVVAEYRVHGANHHAAIARDRTEEFSIIRLLDRVFSEEEEDKRLEAQKRKHRRSIYAMQYLDFADKYFGFGMNRDARRCYWQAAMKVPTTLFRRAIGRRLVATYMPRSWYDSAKRAARIVSIETAKRT